ncbi:MFS transporter [Actinoplanes xinjiangensis]|uniref:Fucose permease n=1 Tax=Actinoplanes xinjiangensis TaxID=512350 RepID=A0A316FBM1_9ACTN|nr:MFS transporter [Actinoplanes xinjiangensis]PWK43475.1 fucose permease [Actinoplanes xinjiangensis]GIF41791.1 MFS transporter [Actinoplanes xinjiangensis]
MPPDTAVLRRARTGVFGTFATSGFVMGAWAAALPSVDRRLDLGEARLGTVLLLIQVVGLVTMLAAGKIADRITSRSLLRWTGPATQLVLVAPALAPSYETLLVCGAIYGIGVGFVEVGLNAHSVELERYYRRPIISSFHGFWSLGGAAAGALTSVGLTLGLGNQAMLVIAALASAAVFAAFTRPLLPPPGQATADSTGTPGGPVRIGGLVLGAMFVLGLGGHLVESGAVDWANLHAARVLDADDALAPLSYTVFAVAMTIFRLLGDPIRARLGPARTLLAAGTLATAGYALVLSSAAAGGLPLAWAGWILAGSGIAVIVPVLFSAVGQAGGPPSNVALISISGSAGLLAGPAAIGYLAEATNLTAGLLIPATLAVFIALAGPLTMRRLLTTRVPETDGPRPGAQSDEMTAGNR